MSVEESLERALVRLQADLGALGIRWALVGGMAFTARVEPRTTRDVDAVVAVTEGTESTLLIRSLRDRGYRHLPSRSLFDSDEPLRELRFESPEGVRVDLILDWSGIEPETIESAEVVPYGPIAVPVCRAEHLLAMKVHADRPKDRIDAEGLVKILSSTGILRVRELLDLIARRTSGDRSKLQRRLSELLAERS